MKITTPATSLYFLLARDSPVGVIFRRGPSKQVQLIKWYLSDDTFEEGQWLKGRIYERRCDLTPDGDFLIYFAATYKEPVRSWTAISKPPWLTALALWPKGDGWNGGGYFFDKLSILLNHPTDQLEPHADFIKGCGRFRIKSSATHHGEDGTVWFELLKRDHWELIENADWNKHGEVKGYSWKAKKPEIWRKTNPVPNRPFCLEMAIVAIGKRNGRWYNITYRVLDKNLKEHANLGLLDCAEWDKNGDLLFSRDGKLFRQRLYLKGGGKCKEIADFSGNRFEAIKAPEQATRF